MNNTDSTQLGPAKGENNLILTLIDGLRSGRVTLASASDSLAQRGPQRSQRRASFTRAALAAGLQEKMIAQVLGHRWGRYE